MGLASCSLQGTVASTASCLQLHKRAERVAAALMGRLNTGDHVALVYPPGKRRCCHKASLPFIFLTQLRVPPVFHRPDKTVMIMLHVYVQEST